MRAMIQFGLMSLGLLLFGLIIYGPDHLDSMVPLLPPILAIGTALITKNVLIALFVGIFVGALGLNDALAAGHIWTGIGSAFMAVADTHVVKAIADNDHAFIILFTLTIGGVVGIMSRSGGLLDVVDKLSHFCRDSKRTQLTTWFVGLAIFFDDYASTVVTGNSMRPLADRSKLSREKFSFIVDATAAPIASLVVISTWIGFELSLMSEALQGAGLTMSAYAIFMESIPYRFYAILIMVFIIASALFQRDFGSMLAAERRAFRTGATLRPGSTPATSEHSKDVQPSATGSWLFAVIPIVVLVAGVFAGLIITGSAEAGDGPHDWGTLMSHGNSFIALLWGALLSSVVSFVMVLSTKLLTLDETTNAWIGGVRSMVVAMIVLSLAWALSGVIGELKTAEAIAELTVNILTPQLFPVIVFILSAVVSFATGTSWGTMAILFPMLIPLLVQLGGDYSVGASDLQMLMTATMGAILTGSIFGDHCSPISDTTIMSSTFAAVDHLDHVKTQLGYALPVGAIAALLGYLPAGYGYNPWLLLCISSGVVIAMLLLIGRDPRTPVEQDQAST